MNNKKIALKSGYYFMIFNENEVPFFNELEITDIMVSVDNIEYNLYQAKTWDMAKQIDALMDSKNIGVGYDIDEYRIKKDIYLSKAFSLP